MRVEPRLQQAEDLRFHRVVARGYYDARNQVLIGNRVHEGRVGYHVITPLRIEGGEVRVLVNRGWVPQREDGAPPPIDVPAGLVEAGGSVMYVEPLEVSLEDAYLKVIGGE